MSTKTSQIIAAKHQAGSTAYLWLQADAGDCILWPSEASSQNDAGSKAIGRWTLTKQEADDLIQSGEVDELN